VEGFYPGRAMDTKGVLLKTMVSHTGLLRRNLLAFSLFGSIAVCQTGESPRPGTYEGQDATVLSNGKLELTVLTQGSIIASILITDGGEKLNPLWNPLRLAREAGRDAAFNGTLGHFVCVDGFGQPSAEERAAGLPQHGEAHMTRFNVAKDAAGNSVSLNATLPIVQENFLRTFRMAPGENVIYVDSQLENLLGFDRPVNWAEHATVSAPFVEPGQTTIALSGTRSQNRDYLANQAGRGGGRAGNAGRGGNAPATQRRLVSGKDFTWPNAEGLDGTTVDMSAVPENPHFIDHAATLMDPARKLEWVTVLNSSKRLIYGYVFRREDYPWLQHWGNYPSVSALVRGLEFATQPYDVARREAISTNSLFGTPEYRWLPAKSKIESHFLIFYARVPEGFRNVDNVTLENGSITIEDRSGAKQIGLAASRGL
jgi:hypothetical protein